LFQEVFMRNPPLRVFAPMIERRIPMYHVALVRDESVPYESEPLEVNTPEQVAAICADLRGLDREAFEVLCLSTKNRLLARVNVSLGSLNASIVHPREVFKAAIIANAASVVLVHVHPSGLPDPSGADVQLTRRLCRAGDVLGIEILDSVVLGGGDTTAICSMRELGML
jgi:DNA repair protein RadC